MDTRELLKLISSAPGTVSPTRHLELINELGRLRLAAAARQQQTAAGVTTLSAGGLPGRQALQLIMGRRDYPIEVRCQAAAVLAQTDGASALAVCVDLL